MICYLDFHLLCDTLYRYWLIGLLVIIEQKYRITTALSVFNNILILLKVSALLAIFSKHTSQFEFSVFVSE